MAKAKKTAPKMTLKKWEKTSADKKTDKKYGEGTKADKKVDRVAVKKANKK
jgi:hypothetical protein